MTVHSTNRGNSFFIGTKQLKVFTSQEGGPTVKFQDRSTDPDDNDRRLALGSSAKRRQQLGAAPDPHIPTPGPYNVSLAVTDAAGKTNT